MESRTISSLERALATRTPPCATSEGARAAGSCGRLLGSGAAALMASSCEFRAWSARASPALCRNHAASFASIASCPGPSARWGAKELLGGDSAPAGGGGPAPAPEVLSTRCCRRCSSPSARRPSAPKRTPAPLSCASRTSSAKAGGSLPRVAPGMAGPSTESSAAAARSASAAARDPSAGPKRDLPSAADEAGAGDALASSAPAGPGRGAPSVSSRMRRVHP